MKFWRFSLTKTPRPISPRLVSDVTAIVDEKLAEVWEAISTLREDVTGAKRVAAKTERAVYRKAGQLIPDDGVELTQASGQPNQRVFRTGDPLEVR